MAQVLAGGGSERLRITVQFPLGIGQMHQRHHCKQHPLIPGGQVVQHLSRLFSLLLQIIRHHRREVVIAVLPPLPVGHVGLHTQQAALQLPYRLIRRYWDDVNGQHQVPVQCSQLVDHGVLDVAGILFEEQHPPVLVPHDKVVFLELQAVRADSILEGMPFPHTVPEVDAEPVLLSGAVEVMEDSQPFHGIQLFTVGVQTMEVGSHIMHGPVKKRPGLLRALAVDREGDIPLLHHAVGSVGGLVQKHGVVLRPVSVQMIVPARDEDLLFHIFPCDALVVDGDLGRRPGIQCIEQFGVIQEHRRLVLF